MNSDPNPASAREPITVVFASDDHYCQHLAVTILSLLESNPQENFRLIVLSIAITALHRNRLQSLVADRPSASLAFVELDATPYRHFRVDGHVSWAAYARIFIPQLVPQDIAKILYLDCDLYVADSIRPLWETDLAGYALAAVPVVHDQLKRDLGIPADKNYVNSGVLLMNLAHWRERDLTGTLVGYIENNARLLKNWDQDAINAVLHDQILPLGLRWNVVNRVFVLTAAQLRISPEEQQALKTRPGIVHFTTHYKPWDYFNPNPFARDYWRLLRKTPYRDFRPPLASALKRLPAHLRPGSLLRKVWPRGR